MVSLTLSWDPRPDSPEHRQLLSNSTGGRPFYSGPGSGLLAAAALGSRSEAATATTPAAHAARPSERVGDGPAGGGVSGTLGVVERDQRGQVRTAIADDDPR
jgi:hypothetical protein